MEIQLEMSGVNFGSGISFLRFKIKISQIINLANVLSKTRSSPTGTSFINLESPITEMCCDYELAT
jgi:hypothetical protein